jgi:phosphoribosylaminoimidazolecarboxamide formyltransferase / IMP cyclohydrolase
MSTKLALISVSDKENLEFLASSLIQLGYKLIASGGTFTKISSFGLQVETVESITKAAEMLGGRVKTLHPAVHGGILSTNSDKDLGDMKARGYDLIDIVVCNLYPFQSTISSPDCTISHAIEQIDIGGVTLLRAAAKNHERVLTLCDPKDYSATITLLKSGSVPQKTRNSLALKAFTMTSDYDLAISSYFQHEYAPEQVLKLRYGANPHQGSAECFASQPLPFKVLSGSPGYINLLDALNAWLFKF